MSTELRCLLDSIPKLETTEQVVRLESIRETNEHSIAAIDSDHLFHDWGT